MRPRGIGRPNFRPKMNVGRKSVFSKPKRYGPAAEAYGENWDELRAYCLKRDNYTCQINKLDAAKRCNAYYPGGFAHLLHVHHIVPLPRGSNHPTNLIVLCKECHGALHNKYLGQITAKQKQASGNTFRKQS